MTTAPITAGTITAILNGLRVPAELHTDPELQAVAYGLAFLDAPATAGEERFYESGTVFYDHDTDSDFPSRYEVKNRDLMIEQLSTRASTRTADLLHGTEPEGVNIR
ncbi:hypothetical protein AB4Y88_00385 [Paenarthrobacter sp. RAF9]